MSAPSVRCYDYVNQPYPRVREALLANPHYVFRQATSAATAHAARLHVHVGVLDIGTDVEIQITSVEQDVAYDEPATRLVLAWQAVHNPGVFPAMTAMLTIFPLSPTETQLELAGTYDPPLGKVGDAIDAAVGHRFASAAVIKFIQEVAGWLREELAMPAMTEAIEPAAERAALDSEC
jgi:hypothetical protein